MPSSVGIEPVITLLPNLMISKLVSNPNSVGIVPVKSLLFDISNDVRPVNRPNSVGRDPAKLLRDSTKETRVVKRPTSVGIVPFVCDWADRTHKNKSKSVEESGMKTVGGRLSNRNRYTYGSSVL